MGGPRGRAGGARRGRSARRALAPPGDSRAAAPGGFLRLPAAAPSEDLGRCWESPRAPAPPLPRAKVREPLPSSGGRSGEAQAAGTATSSGFRGTRAAGPAAGHFLRDRARHGPGGPLPGPQAPGLVGAPRAGDLHSHPVGWSCDCHSPAAETRALRERASAAAHRGQVRGGDGPGGGDRCSPAPQPGPRADPSVPFVPKAGLKAALPSAPGGCGRQTWRQRPNRPNQPLRVSVPGSLGDSLLISPQGHLLWSCTLLPSSSSSSRKTLTPEPHVQAAEGLRKAPFTFGSLGNPGEGQEAAHPDLLPSGPPFST